VDTRWGLLRFGVATLVWLAGIEWLLGRAISRLAASPALDGTPRLVIEFLGSIGLFLLAPATLLAVCLALLAISTDGADALVSADPMRLARAIYLGLFVVLSGALIVIPKTSWLSITHTLMALVAFWWVALTPPGNRNATVDAERVRSSNGAQRARLGVTISLVAATYSGYLFYILMEELGQTGLTSVVSPIVIRDLGEAFLVAVPFALFGLLSVPFRQWAKPRRWILPFALALLFSVANLADMFANQGFTGVFAIWSMGLSFYLPWPLYAISIALYAYSILTCFSPDKTKSDLANRDRAAGLLLLIFASYELQFPYQYILALLSLMLLSGIVAPSSAFSPEGGPVQASLTLQRDVDAHAQGHPPGVTT
jgi:hypothetical protein